jgi:hypothetical protein
LSVTDKKLRKTRAEAIAQAMRSKKRNKITREFASNKISVLFG